MAPTTPGRGPGEDFVVGESVDVPGSMHGTVRFIGSIPGKKGVFAGIELGPEFSARGKNSGDVDGYVCLSSVCDMHYVLPDLNLVAFYRI